MAPKALIDVLLGGGLLRVLPGDLCLVRFKDSALPQTDFERVSLWPITNTEWMVLSPTGHVVSEELSGYERVIKITGQGYYPADVDKVTAFELPLDFVELQQWITTGRKEARLARSLRGLTLVGPEPVAAVDGWSGDPVALPAESVVGRITQRLSRKQAPPATGGVPVIVPLAGQEDLPPLGAPKEPPPDLLAEPAAPILPEAASPGDAAGGGPAIQPDPRKLFSKEVLTPKKGCTWVCIDALRSDKYSCGVAVDLAPGSVVRDDAGLFKVSDRDYVPVRQFDVGQTPFLQKRALNNLGWLGVEERRWVFRLLLLLRRDALHLAVVHFTRCARGGQGCSPELSFAGRGDFTDRASLGVGHRRSDDDTDSVEGAPDARHDVEDVRVESGVGRRAAPPC